MAARGCVGEPPGERTMCRFRFNTAMLSAAQSAGSTDLLSTQTAVTLIATVPTLLVALVALRLQYVTNVPHRRIRFGTAFCARLLDRSLVGSGVDSDLHVLWRDEELADPYVLKIDLAYRGRKDLGSDSFDKERPFCIDVGVPIIELLEIAFEPDVKPLPRVEAVGTELRLGPDLLRKNQGISFTVLTDGMSTKLIPNSPLRGVDLDQKASYQATQDVKEAQQVSGGLLRTVIAWAIVLFVVFYVATEPGGAAALIHHVYNGLHEAADSLATFVNSL
jgi:hypothetical protein